MASGFLLDEHLRGPLYDAIVAHNARCIAAPLPVERVGDPDDLPLGSDDPSILRWAEREDRIIVTLDRKTMARHFYDHLAGGRHSPGLFFLPNSFAIPDVLESLFLAHHAAEPFEWRTGSGISPFDEWTRSR